MINHSHHHEILYEHKILKIDFLELCLLNFILCHNESIYSGLLESVHFIYNFLMLYIFYNIYLNVVIDVKHIKEMNNLKKYTENYVHKSKLAVNNYEI